jgi:hypothetical protein
MAALTNTNPTGSDILAATQTRFFNPQHIGASSLSLSHSPLKPIAN